MRARARTHTHTTQTHTRAHTRTHTRARTYTRARAHTHIKAHSYINKKPTGWTSQWTKRRVVEDELHLVINMGDKKCTADILSALNMNLPIPTSTCLLTVRFMTPVQVPSFLWEPKALSPATQYTDLCRNHSY